MSTPKQDHPTPQARPAVARWIEDPFASVIAACVLTTCAVAVVFSGISALSIIV